MFEWEVREANKSVLGKVRKSSETERNMISGDPKPQNVQIVFIFSNLF